MFDNLTRQESLDAINVRVKSIDATMRDNTIPHAERKLTIEQCHNEIRKLWYHIYDLEGKPYTRE